MGTVTITQFSELDVRSGIGMAIPVYPAVASANVTSSGTSAQSAILAERTRYVIVTTDTAVRVAVGANPTATSADLLVPVGGLFALAVTGVNQRIAVIDA